MNETDRELLELAAKAAGIYLTIEYLGHEKYKPDWNPLTDDGDALRLAVELDIDIVHAYGTRTAAGETTAGYSADGQDNYAATRRAIVRAAAEIGRGQA